MSETEKTGAAAAAQIATIPLYHSWPTHHHTEEAVVYAYDALGWFGKCRLSLRVFVTEPGGVTTVAALDVYTKSGGYEEVANAREYFGPEFTTPTVDEIQASIQGVAQAVYESFLNSFTTTFFPTDKPTNQQTNEQD